MLDLEVRIFVSFYLLLPLVKKGSKFVSNMAPVFFYFAMAPKAVSQLSSPPLIISIDFMEGIEIRDRGFKGFRDAEVDELKTRISVLVN